MFRLICLSLLILSSNAHLELAYKQGEALGREVPPFVEESKIKELAGVTTETPREAHLLDDIQASSSANELP